MGKDKIVYEDSLDLFDFHVSNCGKDSFKKLLLNKSLSNFI